MPFYIAKFPLASAIWIFKGMFLSSSSSFAPAVIVTLSLSPSRQQQPLCWQFGKTIFQELINLYWKTPHMLLFLFTDVESESQN